MCRFPLSIRFLVALTLMTWGAAQGFAQGNAGAERSAPIREALLESEYGLMLTNVSLGARALARARFEASRADPDQRAQARVEAAAQVFRAVMEEYRRGRIAIDRLAWHADPLLRAELDAASRPADQVIILKQRWQWALAHEGLIKARAEALSRSFADLADVQAARLRAEARWIEARKKTRARDESSRIPIEPPEGSLSQRQRARAEFAAVHADPRQRDRDRLSAMREAFPMHWQSFLTARRGLPLLLDSLERYNAAVSAVLGPGAQSARAWQDRLERVRTPYRLIEARFAAGSASTTEEATARALLVQTQAGWVRARKAAPVRPLQRLPLGGEQAIDLEWLEGPGVEKRLAQDLFQASRSQPQDLERAFVLAIQDLTASQLELVRAEREVAYQMVESWRHLLEAERTVARTAADRAALREHFWILRLCEEKGALAGPANAVGVARARRDRLEAEIRWQKAPGESAPRK